MILHGFHRALEVIFSVKIKTVFISEGVAEKSSGQSSLNILLRSPLIKSSFSHLRAINVEPPVAYEVLLIEQSSVRTEEAVLDQGTAAVRSANMK